ncbi:MAG: hypothetical protein SWH78_07985 [Thermodesulfobacteriota bacterium]|nr:hypothetical protein [Thermodesulfobacteriota bacterium]
MSVRIQVVLNEQEAARFKSQAQKESKSMSAWLRDAGRKMLETNKPYQSLTEATSLKDFFKKCNKRERGKEPDWEEHKKLIVESMQGHSRP